MRQSLVALVADEGEICCAAEESRWGLLGGFGEVEVLSLLAQERVAGCRTGAAGEAHVARKLTDWKACGGHFDVERKNRFRKLKVRSCFMVQQARPHGPVTCTSWRRTLKRKMPHHGIHMIISRESIRKKDLIHTAFR